MDPKLHSSQLRLDKAGNLKTLCHCHHRHQKCINDLSVTCKDLQHPDKHFMSSSRKRNENVNLPVKKLDVFKNNSLFYGNLRSLNAWLRYSVLFCIVKCNLLDKPLALSAAEKTHLRSKLSLLQHFITAQKTLPTHFFYFSDWRKWWSETF